MALNGPVEVAGPSPPFRASVPEDTEVVPSLSSCTPIVVVPEPAFFCKVPVLTSVGAGSRKSKSCVSPLPSSELAVKVPAFVIWDPPAM